MCCITRLPCLLLGLSTAVAAVATSVAHTQQHQHEARDLRVEYAQLPVAGVGVSRPRFSWALEHPERGAMQHTYHLAVHTAATSAVFSRLESHSRASAAESTLMVWDSGVVASNATLGIKCGAALASDTTYNLTVVWTDQHGIASAAASGLFSTALLQSSSDAEPGWEGTSWLGLPNNSDTRNQFRTTITLPVDKTVMHGSCFVAGQCHPFRRAHHVLETTHICFAVRIALIPSHGFVMLFAQNCGATSPPTHHCDMHLVPTLNTCTLTLTWRNRRNDSVHSRYQRLVPFLSDGQSSSPVEYSTTPFCATVAVGAVFRGWSKTQQERSLTHSNAASRAN
jgi:hypothetical protein